MKRYLLWTTLIASTVASQLAGYGLVISGQWAYLLALLLGSLIMAGSIILLADERNSSEQFPQNHYHLYVNDTGTVRNRSPNPWTDRW